MPLHFFSSRPLRPFRPLQAWLLRSLGLLAAMLLSATAQASLTYDTTTTPTLATVTTPGLSVTDSQWMRCPVGMTPTAALPVSCTGTPTLFTYTAARAYVASINAGVPEANHWRIPSAEYLGALRLSPLPSPLPVPPEPLLDTTTFPNTPIDDVFWTSTPTGYFPLMSQMRLTVDFANGSMSTYRGIGGTDKGYLRLVRAAPAQLHTVTVTTIGNGTVSPATAMQTSTANLIFDLAPTAGYQLTEVAVTSGSCVVDELSSLLLGKAYVTQGTDDCEVRALFTAAGGTWPITTGTSGPGTLNCPATAANLDDTDCYATPSAGYRLSHFTGCDATTGNTCHLRSVTSARHVVAFFEVAPVSSPASIPTLGFWGLLALSALLGLGGIQRRRRER
jgi:hypothetical protein